MVKPFFSENACFSISFNNKSETVVKIMQSAYLCVILHVKGKKITISRGFNVISNS